jgi:hypothetical protein
MNAINELKSQFNENDDLSDYEEYHHTAQSASYPDVLNTKNSFYSNQAMNSNVNLHQYGSASNVSLPQINGGLSFPRHVMDSPRASTTNLAKNFPPTYYTYSQRLDDVEGANIEV